MSAFIKRIFGGSSSGPAPPPSTSTSSQPQGPDAQAKEWKKKLNAEARAIDRQIHRIQREEQKVKSSAKQAAKQGDTGAVKILAREMLHARHTCKRLVTAKTQMNSVAMQIQMQAAQMKVVGGIQKSTEVMAGMNDLCRIPEISAQMQEMSREMTKAGLIEEMVGDTIDEALDDGIEEDELDDEVAKVVKEVMDAQLKPAKVGTHALPQPEPEPVEEPIEEEEDDEALMAKFKALKANATV